MEDPRPGVVASIQNKLGSLPTLSPNCCIYRVPENLRKVNEDAYRPLLISIGPFYYNDPRLPSMQEQKLRYFQSFLQRNNAYSVGYYVDAISGWEQITRQFYVEAVNLSRALFIEMVLVDAVFIIELFLRGCLGNYIDGNDHIFNKPRMILEVTRDIRLQENQLPFFILKGLYDLACLSSQNQHLSFIDLTYRFLTEKKDPVPQTIATADIKHLVDFLRVCHLPSSPRSDNQTIEISASVTEPSRRELPSGDHTFVFSPSVTELSEAGVKFKVRKSDGLLDIRFGNGVLEIPRLILADDTESLFRNIMVFEQCHYYFDSYIIDYFAFMNGLVNTPKDVETLVQHGIIQNWLGSNEQVANFFNNIFKQIRLRVDNFYYSHVCRDLNTYASTPWHRWKAILKHDYFNHPWAAISVIYAIVILILTVLQVVSGFK